MKCLIDRQILMAQEQEYDIIQGKGMERRREARFLRTALKRNAILRVMRLGWDWCEYVAKCDEPENEGLWAFKLQVMNRDSEELVRFLRRVSRSVLIRVLSSCFDEFNRCVKNFVTIYLHSAVSVSKLHRRLQVVCSLMYDALLTPFMDDTFRVRSTTMEGLVVQSLETKAHVTCLVLTTWTDHSAHVEAAVKHLRHLQSLVFMVHCTDKVVQQLHRHCKGLKKLDMYASRRVTDACSVHLFDMETLQYVNLQFTGTTRDEAIKILLGVYGEYRMALFRTFLFP